MALLRFLVFALIVAGAFGFIIYQIAKFSFFINSPKSIAKKDSKKLRQTIQHLVSDLVPLTDQEVELFSLNRHEKRERKPTYTLISGVYKSIYHEPLMAFALKRYRARDMVTLLAKTFNHEFFYLDTDGDVKVYHNGEELGVINNEGQLINPQRNELLASIDDLDVLRLNPITIEKREVGKLLNPVYADTVNPRAFHLIEEMNDREKVLFMAITFYHIAFEIH